MSVYKRRDRWFFDITIEGKRVQRVIKGANSRTQALKAAARIEQQLFERHHKLEQIPEVRFDKFVADTFLPYSKTHKKSYTDDIRYCRMLNGFFGKMYLSEITPAKLEAFKQARLAGTTMYKRQRHPATVNRELCVLSKIFSLAFDAELIDSNPCRRVRKLRAESKRTRYLSEDEEARLYEALSGQDWIKNIVTVAIHTGMRQGEIFKLTWFDVDLTRNVLHLRDTKNGKSRFVPINRVVRELLDSLPRTSSFVFPSPKTGGRIVDVKRSFDPAKERAGIKNFRFHDLRHTAATRMADAGADAFVLSSIFGWSDIRMALRYTHATDEAKRRAVESLVKSSPSSDESVTNEKGKSANLP